MPERENKVVGEVLRAFRERTDLSQEDAAHAAGLHRAQYGHYEQGRNAVSFVVMLRIARALGVSVQELADAVEKALPKSKH
jgi:transcriptional regulator with XRE-family HTH domain